MIVSVILAMAEHGVIGRANQLPWHLPEDLRNFRRLTLDKPIVMGRHTWQSLPGPLPRRRSIVVTKADLEGPCECVRSPQEAVQHCAEEPELMIIGGVRLFQYFLPRCDRLYLTRIEAQVAGDIVMSPPELSDFVLQRERRVAADERHAYPFRMLEYQRRQMTAQP